MGLKPCVFKTCPRDAGRYPCQRIYPYRGKKPDNHVIKIHFNSAQFFLIQPAIAPA